MNVKEADPLPPLLREALLAEIDPGETLRWCGRPLVSRVVNRELFPAMAACAAGLIFGGAFLLMAISTRAQLLGVEPIIPVAPERNSTWAGVWMSIGVGAGIVALSVVGPFAYVFSAGRRARRTVYALTGTRVFKLWLDGRARARVFAVEPGHPLSLSRHDLGDGVGDINLYPSQSRSSSSRIALLQLIGVAQARKVERLIRATFDPAGGART
ncbi:MAG: hypothetical protein H7210_14050 [Pyrinomonadaceae bacterium]|nr:hypothetical protein [Phycisphaerales bacterium]